MTTVKSVTKALKILEVFQTNKSELAFGEIVDALKISKASAFRLISTLVKEGFLKQQKKRGKYSLGIKLFDITESNIRAFKTENTAIPNMLVDLSRLVNESVSFTVWYGSEILFSRSFTNGKPYYSSPIDFDTQVLHQTCVGKIFLASVSDEDQARYFRRKIIVKNTPNPGNYIKKLKKQLAIIRREGLSFEDGENYSGMAGLAAAIKNSEGDTIGAVHLIKRIEGPITQTVLKKIAPIVQKCALKISTELGYQT